ncbi:hypothetical protein [Ancylobacter sp. Lp-2]|nr:hypothetical protein [Ancylobacter sp. Lp-2]
MRSFVIAATVLALAAFPCAWDTNPREAPPVLAILAAPAGR